MKRRGMLMPCCRQLLLSFASKQMSLYYSTKALWQKHAHTHRLVHTSSWINQYVLVAVISQGALLPPPLGERCDKAKERPSHLLPLFLPCLRILFLFTVIDVHRLLHCLTIVNYEQWYNPHCNPCFCFKTLCTFMVLHRFLPTYFKRF